MLADGACSHAEALAASTVKVAARDVIATWKILISLGATPFLYGFYAFLATLVAIKAGAPLRWRIGTPFLTMIALPLIGFSALKFGEAGMDVAKWVILYLRHGSMMAHLSVRSLRPLVVSLFPGQQRQLDKLKEQRQRLSNELSDVINEFGPKLYEDFDEASYSFVLQLLPHAKQAMVLVEDSCPVKFCTSFNRNSGRMATEIRCWRRRGRARTASYAPDDLGKCILSANWRDAQRLPQLDERLFGWSRSARRGDGGVHSNEVSHMHTPAESEDEDDHGHGDYDNVVGYIPGYVTPSGRNRSRSLANSYADLQQLRKSSDAKRQLHAEDHHLHARKDLPRSPFLSTSSLPNGQSPVVSPGGTRRERRGSLSDKVSVDRLAQLEPMETFQEATDDINREFQLRRRNNPVVANEHDETKNVPDGV